MKFEEFFDIHNPEHLRAYRHLRDVGVWPEGFIPKDLEMGHVWQMWLISKMAEEWYKDKVFKVL